MFGVVLDYEIERPALFNLFIFSSLALFSVDILPLSLVFSSTADCAAAWDKPWRLEQLLLRTTPRLSLTLTICNLPETTLTVIW